VSVRDWETAWSLKINKRLGLEIRSTDRSICCLIQSTSHYVANMDI